MKACLNCQKEYESRSLSSKFCSTRCRVAHHRKNPNPNKSVTVQEMKVLYNKVISLIDAIPTGLSQQPAFNPAPITVIPVNRFGEYRNRIKTSRSLDELKEIMMDVDSDSMLIWKEKQTLRDYAKSISQDMF
jgi:hypothetical protein